LIALVQRVTKGSVSIEHQLHSAIGEGVLALVCAERGDGQREARLLADKTLELRLFSDQQGAMNRSLLESGHALLAVPQFTLAADTSRGRRPSFTPAAPPDEARLLFDQYVEHSRGRLSNVKTGVFGANMQVALINDGPVTFGFVWHPNLRNSHDGCPREPADCSPAADAASASRDPLDGILAGESSGHRRCSAEAHQGVDCRSGAACHRAFREGP